jgi:hypothetical protein
MLTKSWPSDGIQANPVFSPLDDILKLETLKYAYFPDKFIQRWGDKMNRGQKEKIMQLVKETFQNINGARSQPRSFYMPHTG